MLGLGQQVGGDEVAAGAGVGQHEQVAGAGEAVDADVAGDLALGLLHVEAARAGDHVDAADRLGAVGERGDGLRAAHPQHLVDPAQRAAARITGWAPGAHTTTSSTPAARAVTTPMTTVLG